MYQKVNFVNQNKGERRINRYDWIFEQTRSIVHLNPMQIDQTDESQMIVSDTDNGYQLLCSGDCLKKCVRDAV